MRKNLLRSIATTAAVAAVAGPLSVATATGADASPLPKGALQSARAALASDWDCDRIADEKFGCYQDAADPFGAAFTVVLRPTSSLPKWQDDPELATEIAVVRKRYFLTVQPTPELSSDDFEAVKSAVARSRR